MRNGRRIDTLPRLTFGSSLPPSLGNFLASTAVEIDSRIIPVVARRDVPAATGLGIELALFVAMANNLPSSRRLHPPL
jgi:hypothetical protein